MKKLTLFMIVFFSLSGCLTRVVDQEGGGRDPVIEVTTPRPTDTARPTATRDVVVPTAVPTPTAPADGKSNTYQDDEIGFAFAYPAEWAPAYQEGQSRGRFIQFARAAFQPDPDAGGLPAEEIRMQVSLLGWEPTADLAAYLEVRRSALENSGAQILSEEHWTWGADVPGVTLIVQGIDGVESILSLTYVGDLYLTFSAGEDFQMVDEAARSLRVP